MEAMGRPRPDESIPPDLEAGLTSPLLPAGPVASGHEPEPSTTTLAEEEQDVELGNQQEEEVTTNFVSRMREMVHFWWSSVELTPSKPKLYICRLLFLIAFTALLPVVMCGAVILTYIVVMMVLVPRVVVVNYLVAPYMADSPDWGPSLIALVSAMILGTLFMLDDWAERKYNKELFGLWDWSDSWICRAAQIVLLYLFFETVYISLSTFILSFLSTSPKVASVGLMFVSAGPQNVLALLLASATVAILLSVCLFCTARKIDAAEAGRSDVHSSPMNPLAWNTLVFVDTVLRVIHYIFLFTTTLCCIYFIVYGSYKLCSFLIHHLVHAFHVHDFPDVIPFPSLD